MRFLIVLLSFTCIALASCKKSRFNSSNSLVGKWTITETNHIGAPWVQVMVAEQHSYEFRSDSTYTYTPPLISSMSPCIGTYKTSGDTLIINWDCGPGPSYKMEMVYSVSNNVLVLDYFASATGVKARYKRN